MLAVKVSANDVISAFKLIAWLTSLKKMTFELIYGNLSFINNYCLVCI